MKIYKRGDLVRHIYDDDQIAYGIGIIHDIKLFQNDLIANAILARTSFDYWKTTERRAHVHFSIQGSLWICTDLIALIIPNKTKTDHKT